jgi:Fic family protein
MMTLRSFQKGLAGVPVATAWSLAELGQALGRQELFIRQSPQRLRALREHALIESAVSSNRIEGVEVDAKRIGTLVFGKAALRDRDEEEVRGYRDALNLIHTEGGKLPVSQQTIRKLHRLARGSVWDAGQYKQKDTDIIERFADGRERVRFRPTRARQTPAAMAQLVELWRDCLREKWVPPLVAVAAFNLDFLCIHPFRDGNGRVSRLLLLLQCYHAGAEVGRYIGLERLIEQNKDRYTRRWSGARPVGTRANTIPGRLSTISCGFCARRTKNLSVAWATSKPCRARRARSSSMPYSG